MILKMIDLTKKHNPNHLNQPTQYQDHTKIMYYLSNTEKKIFICKNMKHKDY